MKRRKFWRGFLLMLLCHGFAMVVLAAPQTASHSVTLAWDPPVLPAIDTADSWNIYRSTASGGPYTLIGSMPVDTVTYVDSSVQAGNEYFYVATSVDAAGIESAYSDPAVAVIPAAGLPLSVTATALPPGTVGVSYSVTLSATGGNAPYTWAGSGVPGLTVNPAGLLAGTPIQSGTFSLTVNVDDSLGAPASVSIPLVVTDPPPPPAPAFPSGLVLYWTFDNANIVNGIVADKSGNSDTGTIFGNPLPVTVPQGQALDLGNSDSYLVAGTDAPAFSNSLTLAAWINTANTSTSQVIFSKYSGNGSGAGYIFSVNRGGNLAVRIGGADLSSFPNRATDVTLVADGSWHHVVATINFESQSIQFYVDGQLTSSTAMNMVPNGDGGATLQVGANSGGTRRDYFTGSIGDVQVYDRALTDDEVKIDFQLTGGGGN